jgi:hypothetical protein
LAAAKNAMMPQKIAKVATDGTGKDVFPSS